MEAPLTGIRVVEVANYLAVPSAAVLMADMGADVIKVEPLEGDPFRQEIRDADYDFTFPISYAFQLDNRGKRGVALNLRREKAVEVVWKLAEEADVFMTNLLPRRLEAFHLRYEDLSPRNPRLIYLAFNGYGPEGPDKDRPAFDYTAFWTRSGAMSLFGEPGQPPVNLRSGFGDHTSSPLLLAGVLAALWARERSGKGQQVTASLLNMGMWVIGGDLSRALVVRQQPILHPRAQSPNPLQNTYRTRDAKWINMVMVNSDANWAKLARAIGREDLISDAGSRTVEARKSRAPELVAEIDQIIGALTLEELAPRLDSTGVIWAPMQTLPEAMSDPQVRANGYITTLDHPTHGPFETLETPLKFSDSDVKARTAAPELGQHTEEVLLDLGYSWDDIEELRQDGAIT